MLLLGKPLEAWSEADITAMLGNVEESKHLDFKRELPGKSDGDKKEFLTDISAMANAGGGCLIFGIDEVDPTTGLKTGRAEQVVPIPATNKTDDILGLESSCASGLSPRLAGLKFFPIDVTGGYVLIAAVPDSLKAPHMVTFKQSQRFYSRNSGGKYPMDVEEIRTAFLASESLFKQAEDWARARCDLMLSSRGIVNPRVVVHIMPLRSMQTGANIDISELSKQRTFLPPLAREQSFEARYTFDSFRTFVADGEDELAWVQFYRSGIIEAADREVFRILGDSKIPSYKLEEHLVKSIPKYLEAQRHVGIEPPLLIKITMLDVGNHFIYLRPGHVSYPEQPSGKPNLIRKARLEFQSIVFGEFPDEATLQLELKKAGDALWNACGFAKSPNWTAEGKWDPKS